MSEPYRVIINQLPSPVITVTQTSAPIVEIAAGIQGPPGVSGLIHLDYFEYSTGIEIVPTKTPIGGKILYFVDGVLQPNIVIPYELNEGESVQLVYLA
ncbi:hypothetical protein HUU62_08595 [Rhodoferax sp. 4810]|uniref:Uncharacterized protein n=1 Tax=Thiospirillum jenense TaxID=1653858 RepID=A0A839HH24_9GAMM|nr:hypothetical protein [Thiospirillum jenense]MBB1074467.1 hypothetical protein [Rhodoferax jenense]MBB1125552.1 hypothetical protein [Thiospirillum jenense]